MASRGQDAAAGDIQWNFVVRCGRASYACISLMTTQKFLVNRDGEAVARYDMAFDGPRLEADIQAQLAQQSVSNS